MADLKYSVTWQIAVNGKTYQNDFNATISALVDADQRDVTVPFATQVDLLKVAATVGAGQFTAIKGLILINNDAVNDVRIRVAKAGADTADINLAPGTFTALWNQDLSTAGGAFAAFVAWDEVNAQASIAAVSLTMLVVE